jgi:hypothetical protein
MTLFTVSRFFKDHQIYLYQGREDCGFFLIFFPGDLVFVAGDMVHEVVSVSDDLLNMD